MNWGYSVDTHFSKAIPNFSILILLDAKKINVACWYKGIVRCTFKSKLLDEIFIQLPVAAIALIKAHVQLTAKTIQANVTSVFHEQNFFQLSSVNY